MSTPTDRERLIHFIQLIGAEPRQTEFDEDGILIKLNLAGLNLRELPPEIGEFVGLQNLVLGETVRVADERIELGNQLTALPTTIGYLINLQELNAEHNQLQSLPIDLSQLVQRQGSFARLG